MCGQRSAKKQYDGTAAGWICGWQVTVAPVQRTGAAGTLPQNDRFGQRLSFSDTEWKYLCRIKMDLIKLK